MSNAVRIVGGNSLFYRDQAGGALTAAFAGAEIVFPFFAGRVTISNDSAVNYIEFSLDGATVHGKLFAGEGFSEPLEIQKLFLRGQAGGEPYRVQVVKS